MLLMPGAGAAVTVLADVPRVIIDTDLGSSVDDLVALDFAARGHWTAKINLLGVMMSRPDGSNPPDDPHGRGEFLKFADAYMTALNMGDVPIGKAVTDLSGVAVFTPYWTLVNSNDTVTGKALMRGSGRELGAFPDAVTLYRRLLDESPDQSVDICLIGMFGNLTALMDSPSDRNGDGIGKSGKELIREKVRALRVMAGCFEGDGIAQGGHGEFNVWGDIDSARRIFGEWPGKIVCSPWEVGLKLEYKSEWMRLDFPYGCRNAVLHAFDRYWHESTEGDEFPNRLWDVMPVVGVVREGLVPLSPCGEIDVERGSGITRFEQRSDGLRRYQYLESEADARSLMNDIRAVMSDGRSSCTWAGRDLGKMDCFVDLKILLAGEGLQSSNELDAAAFALCEKELLNGVAYAEIRFAPEGHGALSPGEAVDAVLAGTRRSAIDARLVLLGSREACRDLVRPGVVGYDDGSDAITSFKEGMSRDRAVEFCPVDDTERSFMELLGSGVKVTVNTGADPDAGLRVEWAKLIGKHALMPQETKAVLLNSVDAAFAAEETKDVLRRRVETAFQPIGSADDPWTPGTGLTAWVEDGTLHIAGSGDVLSTPWTAQADEIVAVEADVRVVGFTSQMLAALPNVTTVNGMSLSQLQSLAPKQDIPSNSVLVSKTELEAAGAVTLAIENGTAYLGVSVRTNADLTVETKNWGRVKFDETTQIGFSEDGTSLIVPVPANAEKGFMTLWSHHQ